MKGAGMKLVYIASPLRGENPSGKDYKKNIEQAAKYCENACSLGVLAFAPHLYFTQFYNDTIPEQREKGLEMGLAMLEKCEELWEMGTHISQGMRGEIAHAKSLGIPIYNVEMPDDIMYYPVSADNHALLGQHSCMPDSRDKDYMGKILVMNYEALKRNTGADHISYGLPPAALGAALQPGAGGFLPPVFMTGSRAAFTGRTLQGL